jgi:tetratricopeptide (TPR) repeat protein
MKYSVKIWAAILYCSLFAMLQGCQSLPQTEALLVDPPTGVASKQYIEKVPFFAQQEFYCGPTTLSEVFHFYSHPISPDQLAPDLFIPQREGSLQIEMVTAARKHGFLAYSEQSNLAQLIKLLDQNVPIIVLQNLSVLWMPQWHYAVVIGYDLENQQFILHTGETKDHTMPFYLFERVWQRANYWMLAPLPVGKTSSALTPIKYIQAAYDQMSTNQQTNAIENLVAATNTWPNEWLPYFLLGNYYLQDNPVKAATWYSKGLTAGYQQAEYLNNYSYALAELGCREQAIEVVEQAVRLSPKSENVKQSKQEIASYQKTTQPQRSCAVYSVSETLAK